MCSILDTLKAYDSSAGNVVSVSVYVRDMTEYSRLNHIYAKFFGLNPPVRACVQVPMLSFAELEVIAIESERSKQNMHVQSLSHWAPANIGPYSQCVQVRHTILSVKCLFVFIAASEQIGDLFLVSGQIGLIPGSMLLPEPASFNSECLLALRHTSRILTAMNPKLTLENSIQVNFYPVYFKQ